MPLLSILVPTFNRVDFLRDCLESLLETGVSCEVLVSDNASDDGTEAYMRSVTDPRVQYFRQPENLGPVPNFNFLLAQATGTYVCIFGDDDLAIPGWFDSKVALLEHNPQIAMVYSQAAGIQGDGTPMKLSVVMGRPTHSYLGGRDEFKELFLNCFISWQTLVFRRSALEEVGSLKDTLGLKSSNDWFWLQGLIRGREVAFIAEPTVKIRFHAGSLTESQAERGAFFLDERLMIWTWWLMESEYPPVLSEREWSRMRQIVKTELEGIYEVLDQVVLERYLTYLLQLRARSDIRIEGAFRRALGEADPFRDRPEPLPLDDRKGFTFLLQPDWSSDRWQAAIVAYARRFSSEDDVSLAVWLDPAQDVEAEEAGRRVMATLADAGIDEGSAPDLLLVPDSLDERGLARLYAAVDCIVADDGLQRSRAVRVGKAVVNASDADAWQTPQASG